MEFSGFRKSEMLQRNLLHSEEWSRFFSILAYYSHTTIKRAAAPVGETAPPKHDNHFSLDIMYFSIQNLYECILYPQLSHFKKVFFIANSQRIDFIHIDTNQFPDSEFLRALNSPMVKNTSPAHITARAKS